MKKIVVSIIMICAVSSSLMAETLYFVYTSPKEDVKEIVAVKDIIMAFTECRFDLESMKVSYQKAEKEIRNNKNMKTITYQDCKSKYTQKGCCDGL